MKNKTGAKMDWKKVKQRQRKESERERERERGRLRDNEREREREREKSSNESVLKKRKFSFSMLFCLHDVIYNGYHSLMRHISFHSTILQIWSIFYTHSRESF